MRYFKQPQKTSSTSGLLFGKAGSASRSRPAPKVEAQKRRIAMGSVGVARRPLSACSTATAPPSQPLPSSAVGTLNELLNACSKHVAHNQRRQFLSTSAANVLEGRSTITDVARHELHAAATGCGATPAQLRSVDIRAWLDPSAPKTGARNAAMATVRKRFLIKLRRMRSATRRLKEVQQLGQAAQDVLRGIGKPAPGDVQALKRCCRQLLVTAKPKGLSRKPSPMNRQNFNMIVDSGKAVAAAAEALSSEQWWALTAGDDVAWDALSATIFAGRQAPLRAVLAMLVDTISRQRGIDDARRACLVQNVDAVLLILHGQHGPQKWGDCVGRGKQRAMLSDVKVAVRALQKITLSFGSSLTRLQQAASSVLGLL